MSIGMYVFSAFAAGRTCSTRIFFALVLTMKVVCTRQGKRKVQCTVTAHKQLGMGDLSIAGRGYESLFDVDGTRNFRKSHFVYFFGIRCEAVMSKICDR